MTEMWFNGSHWPLTIFFIVHPRVQVYVGGKCEEISSKLFCDIMLMGMCEVLKPLIYDLVRMFVFPLLRLPVHATTIKNKTKMTFLKTVTVIFG